MVTSYREVIDTPNDTLEETTINSIELGHYIAKIFFIYWIGGDLDTMLSPDKWSPDVFIRRQIALAYGYGAMRELGCLLDGVQSDYMSKVYTGLPQL